MTNKSTIEIATGSHRRDGAAGSLDWARWTDRVLTVAAFAVVLAVVFGLGTDGLWRDGPFNRDAVERTAMVAESTNAR